jgi:hypothetical protein
MELSESRVPLRSINTPAKLINQIRCGINGYSASRSGDSLAAFQRHVHGPS